MADLLILWALLGACAAVIFAVFYGVSRVLAVVLRFVVRLTGVPPRALVVAGLALGATGVALLVRVHGTANSCDQDATTPFLAAAAVLPLALAIGRQLQHETPARPGAARAIRVLAALAVCAWPVVGARGFLSRDSGRSRSMTIGELRTIVSAEAAYAQENGGFYDRLECLARPQECLLGRAAGASAFLDPITATMGARHAFTRTFRPGPKAPRSPSVSLSSLSTWAVLAVPSPRIRGRCQSYCVDSSGRICGMADGREAPVVDGLCGLACPTLP